MDTFDGDINHFSRRDAGDDKMLVKFYMGVMKDEAASIEAGRPIFKDIEFVKIITPGDKTNIIDQPARQVHRERFPRHYAKFKQGIEGEAQTEGTRLTEWPMISRAQAEELRHLDILTVEQVAGVRDDVMLRTPGLAKLKREAAIWLGKTKSSAEAAKTAKLIEELQAQNAALSQAVNDLQSRVHDQNVKQRAAA